MLPIVFSIQEKKDNIVSSYSGSSFVLKDVNNKTITENSFQGQLTAIFFGFTNCPDICPMTLSNLDQVLGKLNNDERERFKVYFISIDPEKDSPEVIRDYLNAFKNKIYGITGDSQKIFSLSKSWGVLTEKIFTADGGYSINHSSSILLLNRGKYVERISHHVELDEIHKIVKKYL
jgi:protein SCO1/2